MISVSIRPERHSYALIGEAGEFTVNIPPARLARAVDWCGVVSGRDHDKFKERSLTSLPGSQVAAPLVAECPLGLGCSSKRRGCSPTPTAITTNSAVVSATSATPSAGNPGRPSAGKTSAVRMARAHD